MKILSVHLPSNRPVFFRRLVTSLAENASDPTCFEVVVKIDDDDNDMQAEVEALRRTLGVTIVDLISPPPRGYYDLSRFCNDAFAASDPGAYFCWHLNDEVIVETPEWDRLLERYIGFFPDHLFRLKIVPSKMFRNFFDIYEVNLFGDFPITTRRWLELTEGWVHGHGAEPYQEAISFMLAKRDIHRNVPLPDFRFGGDEPGTNLDEETFREREKDMAFHWERNMAPELRERICRCARRIELAVIAERLALTNYVIKDAPKKRRLTLVSDKGLPVARVWYHVDPLAIHLANIRGIVWRLQGSWPYPAWEQPIIPTSTWAHHSFHNLLGGRPFWYKAIVYCWYVGEKVGHVVFLIAYLPVAALFGAPIHCWWEEFRERMHVKHDAKITPYWESLKTFAIRLRNVSGRLRQILKGDR